MCCLARECRWKVPTLGVCDLTLPARASDPWTLPMIAVGFLRVTYPPLESADGSRDVVGRWVMYFLGGGLVVSGA